MLTVKVTGIDRSNAKLQIAPPAPRPLRPVPLLPVGGAEAQPTDRDGHHRGTEPVEMSRRFVVAAFGHVADGRHGIGPVVPPLDVEPAPARVRGDPLEDLLRRQRLPYVVMELINGPTLAQRLAHGRLPVRTALLIGAQIAAALAAAHGRGLVHRDVKPGNVLLSPAGAKVVDFGIAAVAGARADFPSDGTVWGTPAYLAPERLAGGEVVPATDVYALGLILYRLLADAMPWPMDTVSQMLKAHRYAEPAPLPALPELPEEVAGICRRCLAKAPDDRPTAAEVARVLAQASGWPLTSEPGDDEIVVGAALAPAEDDPETRLVPGPVSVVGRAAPVPPKERHRAVSAALVLLALVLLLGCCGTTGHPQAGVAAPAASAAADPAPVAATPTPAGPAVQAGQPAPPRSGTRASRRSSPTLRN